MIIKGIVDKTDSLHMPNGSLQDITSNRRNVDQDLHEQGSEIVIKSVNL